MVALVGVTQADRESLWMDSLMQFVQVDSNGRPVALHEELEDDSVVLYPPWLSAALERGNSCTSGTDPIHHSYDCVDGIGRTRRSWRPLGRANL